MKVFIKIYTENVPITLLQKKKKKIRWLLVVYGITNLVRGGTCNGYSL